MTKHDRDTITSAVLEAIRPSLERIHDRIDEVHGRVTSVEKHVERIDERTAHMPTSASEAEAIKTHADACRSRRNWTIGLIVGPLLAAVIGIVALLQGCEPDPYDGPGEGGDCSPVAATRCLGELAQICSAEYVWETMYDCAEWGMTCVDGECSEIDGGPDAG